MAGRKYAVLLTKGAEQDLESIYDSIAEFDCKANADYVLNRLLEVVESLSTFPECGACLGFDCLGFDGRRGAVTAADIYCQQP